jgi:hypothetical protein
MDDKKLLEERQKENANFRTLLSVGYPGLCEDIAQAGRCAQQEKIWAELEARHGKGIPFEPDTYVMKSGDLPYPGGTVSFDSVKKNWPEVFAELFSEGRLSADTQIEAEKLERRYKVLADMKAMQRVPETTKGPARVTVSPPPQRALTLEERAIQEFKMDPNIKEEFRSAGAYFHYLSAIATGRAKILGRAGE